MNPYIKLMRPEQWYKNILVFLAVFFSKNIANINLVESAILGFVSLSLVSSSYYIINDINDAEMDRIHPAKRHRPVAAGTAGKKAAWILSMALFVSGMYVAYTLSFAFAIFPLALFLSSNAYSLYLKKIAIVDVHAVAVNFLLRAVSGTVLVGVRISPWLVFSIFLIALFLAYGKRLGDMVALGTKTNSNNAPQYTAEFLRGSLFVLAATVIVAYGLYAFLANPGGYMMLGLPFVSFLCFRFLYFALTGNAAAREAHRMFLDSQSLAAFALWAAISFAALYL